VTVKPRGEIRMGDTAYRNAAIFCLVMGVVFVLVGIVMPQFYIDRAVDNENYYWGSIISLIGIGVVFVSFGLLLYREYGKPTPPAQDR